MSDPAFDYHRAFNRNLGLVSERDQERLRSLRVALPGLGGVGGAHLQTLVRMGIGSFHLADPDVFEVGNFNRQLGATLETVGASKAEVSRQMLHAINPSAEVHLFSNGLTDGNMDAFLEGVDVVVDGLEFFRIEIRRKLYFHARAKGIPVVNAGPIGYGAALIVFTPVDMPFDDYFAITDQLSRTEQLLSFGLGLGPGIRGDIDEAYVDPEAEKGPALASACMVCAAAAATEVLKIVTGRGRLATPGRGVYYDLLRNRTHRLKRTPSLRHTLRGRFLRWAIFKKMPVLKRLHARDMAVAPANAFAALGAGRCGRSMAAGE